MSLGPHYENITNADFMMYFSSALVYYYDAENKIGCMYNLYVNEDRERRAHTTVHTLIKSVPGGTLPNERSVPGHELFLSPYYRIHRLPVEYVASDDRLLRISVEPADRRAFKGTSLNYLSIHDIIQPSNINMLSEEEREVLNRHRTGGRTGISVISGIEEVLAIGAPRCMRTLIPAEDVRKNVMDMMSRLFAGLRDVIVPDFTLAVLRINAPCPEAPEVTPYGLVVYRGNVLGTVIPRASKITSFKFTGRILPDDPPDVVKLHKAGAKEVTTRLFADEVAWSTWTPPPVSVDDLRVSFRDALLRVALDDGEEEEPDWPDQDDDQEEDPDEEENEYVNDR